MRVIDTQILGGRSLGGALGHILESMADQQRKHFAMRSANTEVLYFQRIY